jgi:hypothetical protein
VSLFSSKEIAAANLQQPEQKAGSVMVNGMILTANQHFDFIEEKIQTISPGQSCCFISYGAWSNIDLLEYLLIKSGPAKVYFSTWSISAEAISRIAAWHNQNVITDLHVVMDAGLRNRKPDLYQQAVGSFAKLKVTAIHAKVTVVQNENFNLVVIGSANYTKNPRIETGMIINDKTVADFNIKWILEEFHAV